MFFVFDKGRITQKQKENNKKVKKLKKYQTKTEVIMNKVWIKNVRKNGAVHKKEQERTSDRAKKWIDNRREEVYHKAITSIMHKYGG